MQAEYAEIYMQARAQEACDFQIMHFLLELLLFFVLI
jgi:hypothetical protein